MNRPNFAKLLAATSVFCGVAFGTVEAVRGVTFTPPPGSSSPRHGSAASSRSTSVCGQAVGSIAHTDLSVTALLPEGNYGTTLSEHPVIFAYVPQSNARKAMFSLKDGNKKTHYRTTVSLSGQAEIVAVQIPEDAPALKAGETYKWYLALECEGSLRPSNPIEGQIERIEPNSELLSAQQASDSLAAAESYGAAGVWYDTVAMLARLRQSQPTDATIAQHWQELLDSVGLSEVADASLANSL